MGICLDTEPRPVYDDGNEKIIKINGANGYERNIVKEIIRNSIEEGVDTISFITPKVPVIFVLGGPGSGKISHSDFWISENPQWIHINMNKLIDDDLDADSSSTSLLSTINVITKINDEFESEEYNDIEGYLISGFPRSLDDLALYLEKIGRIDCVIYINWHPQTLETQIQYGASLGKIDHEVAKIELQSFFTTTIRVVEYLDSERLIYSVAGDRSPGLVYDDFKVTLNKFLKTSTENSYTKPRPTSTGSYRDYRGRIDANGHKNVHEDKEDTESNEFYLLPQGPIKLDLDNIPPKVVWVVGGPGSSKTYRVDMILTELFPKWQLISVGKLLWNYLEESEEINDNEDNYEIVKEYIHQGNSVPNSFIMDIIVRAMNKHKKCDGYVIVGFPRDMTQIQKFEKQIFDKYPSQPPVILIDCSELELGRNLGKRRGRLDDNIEAYRKRLKLYRLNTLPMLKNIDEQNRLTIVDGDSDDNVIMEQLKNALITVIKSLENETIEDLDHLIDDISEEDETNKEV